MPITRLKHAILFSLSLSLCLPVASYAQTKAQEKIEYPSDTVKTTTAPVFVTPDWAFKNLKNIKLLDVSKKEAYLTYHIPESTWVDYAWLIKPKLGIHYSGGKEYMAQVLTLLGVSPTDHVVLYDNVGNLEASRLYWELKKLNHAKVSIIDGGSVSWILKGLPVTQHMAPRSKANYPVPAKDSATELTATMKEMRTAITDGESIIIDTRTMGEYTGLAKNARTGHIPSALFVPWKASFSKRNAFQQWPKEQMEGLLEKTGITDKNKTIFLYCTTAHRAARLMPMFHSIGYNKVKLYDGSMQEWELDASNPLVQGIKPSKTVN